MLRAITSGIHAASMCNRARTLVSALAHHLLAGAPPMRFSLAVLLLTAACDVKLSAISASLAVDPGALAFPATATGDTRTLPLTLINNSRAPLNLRLSASAPFALDLSVKLEGGESRAVDVPFSPVELGPASASLQVEGDAQTVVALEGEGVAPAVCVSPTACRVAQREPGTNTCTSSDAPDGTDCSSENACLASGHCTGGVCVGAPVSCDDSDACTVDVCESVAGCAHLAAGCPEPSDKCRAAFCDPKLGCSSAPVPDGTSCGPSDCTTADVCMAGTCRTLAVPDGYACGAESPCRSKGRCAAGSCAQPPASPLALAWSYPLPPVTFFDFRGVTDASGNLYLVECPPVVGLSPCSLVSFTPAGVERFRTPVPSVSAPVELRHAASSGRIFVGARNVVAAFSAASGAHLWTRTAIAGTTLLELAADRQGNVRLLERFDAETEAWSLVTLAASTGLANVTLLYGPPHGLVLDEQDNAYFVVSKTEWPLGRSTSPSSGPPGAPPGAGPTIHLLSLTPAGATRFQIPRDEIDKPVAVYNGELLLDSGEVLSTVTAARRPSQRSSPVSEAPSPLISLASRYRWDKWPCCPMCDCNTPPYLRLEGFNVGVAAARFSWGSFSLTDPPVSETLLLDDGTALFASEDTPSRDVFLRALDASGAEKFACLVGPSQAGLRTWQGATALTAGRWAVLNHTSCPTCFVDPPPVLEVYATPGLVLAPTGWTGRAGSPGRSGGPR